MDIIPSENHLSAKQERKTARWNPTLEKFFVQLLIEQLGDKEVGISRGSWIYMTSELNKRYGIQFMVGHLKNRLKCFKRQQQIVNGLRNTPGFRWDENRCIMMADDEVWDEYLLENPDAFIYRNKVWPLYNELELIFGKLAEAKRELRSASSQKNTDDIYEQLGEEMGAIPFDLIVGIESPTISSETLIGQHILQEVPHSNGHRCSQVTKTEYRHRPLIEARTSRATKKSKSTSEGAFEALKEIVSVTRTGTASKLYSGVEKTTLQKCIEELQSIEGLETNVVLEAVELLKDEKNAVIFLTLKGDLRKEWLKKVCSK